jgi:transaldolase
MRRWLAAMAGRMAGQAAWQTSCREESMTARKTKILLDGGDAGETQRIKKLIGLLDGQTTNQSLIAKNLRFVFRAVPGSEPASAQTNAVAKQGFLAALARTRSSDG